MGAEARGTETLVPLSHVGLWQLELAAKNLWNCEEAKQKQKQRQSPQL